MIDSIQFAITPIYNVDGIHVTIANAKDPVQFCFSKQYFKDLNKGLRIDYTPKEKGVYLISIFMCDKNGMTGSLLLQFFYDQTIKEGDLVVGDQSQPECVMYKDRFITVPSNKVISCSMCGNETHPVGIMDGSKEKCYCPTCDENYWEETNLLCRIHV